MTRPTGSRKRRPGRPGLLTAVVLLAALALPVSGPAHAQYYNIGGKNKITHDNFDWKVYQSPHFMIYYYPEVEPFLEKLVSYAESSYLKVSTTLDYQLGFKVPVFFYKTHGEFEQTNITFSTLPEGVGAFATASKNRIVIPIDDPPDMMQITLTHELVHIFQYDLFYQSDLSKAYRSAPPLWIMEGMAEFVGQKGWSTSNEMVIRDAVLNDLVPPILTLNAQSFLTYRFGQAAFDYMNEEWGLEGVRDFIQAFRRHLTTRKKSCHPVLLRNLSRFGHRISSGHILYRRKANRQTLFNRRITDACFSTALITGDQLSGCGSCGVRLDRHTYFDTTGVGLYLAKNGVILDLTLGKYRFSQNY